MAFIKVDFRRLGALQFRVVVCIEANRDQETIMHPGIALFGH